MAKSSAREKNESGERSGEKLDQLLSAAAGLMAREGYEQTSIRDVARESGFSLAGMYYYFQSKEDLLYKIQHRTFASLLEEQENAAAEDGSAEERLRRLIQTHLSFYTRHFSEMKICTFELQSLKGDRYREIEKLRRRYYRIAAEIVEEILASTGRRNDGGKETRHYTLFIFGMLNWIFMWYEPKRDAPVEDLGEKLVNLALHGLRGQK
jgi:TetR/AcrR family transcriptional regulator